MNDNIALGGCELLRCKTMSLQNYTQYGMQQPGDGLWAVVMAVGLRLNLNEGNWTEA